jgi:HSP20 family protein
MSTTDVFVVTDGLNSAYYTNTAGYANNFSITSGNSGLIPTTNGTSASNFINAVYNPPTYNDFWKFDEQFDLLWKSFFENNSVFKPVREKVVNHPCDIQETDNGLRIEVAAIGLDNNDIDIIVDSETLRISYRKTEEEKVKEKDEYRYLHRSIRKASFDIAWKISSKYDLAKLEASLDKGLLTLNIPFAKENKPKKIEIKSPKQILKG